jgi:hypothetical protein
MDKHKGKNPPRTTRTNTGKKNTGFRTKARISGAACGFAILSRKAGNYLRTNSRFYRFYLLLLCLAID